MNSNMAHCPLVRSFTAVPKIWPEHGRLCPFPRHTGKDVLLLAKPFALRLVLIITNSISKKDLSGLDLAGIDFRDAELFSADLDGCKP